MMAAHRLLEDELFKEAFTAIEANIVERLAVPGQSAAEVHELHHSLVAARRVRKYFQNVILTGQLEAMRGKRKR